MEAVRVSVSVSVRVRVRVRVDGLEAVAIACTALVCRHRACVIVYACVSVREYMYDCVWMNAVLMYGMGIWILYTMNGCTYVYIFLYMYNLCMCNICVYVCMYVCMYMCVY